MNMEIEWIKIYKHIMNNIMIDAIHSDIEKQILNILDKNNE